MLTTRRVIVLCVLLIVIAVALASEVLFNPWRKSDAEVREWLLTITPLGSTLDEVQSTLDQRGWDNPAFHKTWLPLADEPFLGGEVGGYQSIPWYVFVDAFWEFDENGRLKDIRIRRVIDSP